MEVHRNAICFSVVWAVAFEGEVVFLIVLTPASLFYGLCWLLLVSMINTFLAATFFSLPKNFSANMFPLT